MYWNKMNGGPVGILPDMKLWAPAARSYATETHILWIKYMENEKQYSCLAGSSLLKKKRASEIPKFWNQSYRLLFPRCDASSWQRAIWIANQTSIKWNNDISCNSEICMCYVLAGKHLFCCKWDRLNDIVRMNIHTRSPVGLPEARYFPNKY